MLEGEPAAGPPEAGLDFVADERHTILTGVAGDLLQPAIRWHDRASLTLNRLEYDGSGFGDPAKWIFQNRAHHPGTREIAAVDGEPECTRPTVAVRLKMHA